MDASQHSLHHLGCSSLTFSQTFLSSKLSSHNIICSRMMEMHFHTTQNTESFYHDWKQLLRHSCTKPYLTAAPSLTPIITSTVVPFYCVFFDYENIQTYPKVQWNKPPPGTLYAPITVINIFQVLFYLFSLTCFAVLLCLFPGGFIWKQIPDILSPAVYCISQSASIAFLTLQGLVDMVVSPTDPWSSGIRFLHGCRNQCWNGLR